MPPSSFNYGGFAISPMSGGGGGSFMCGNGKYLEVGDIVICQDTSVRDYFSGEAIFMGIDQNNLDGRHLAFKRLDGRTGGAHDSNWSFRIDQDGRNTLNQIIFIRNEKETNKKKKEDNSKKSINLSKLDALVIKPEVKEEIIALLKQKQHQTKIFEEWGLGETIEYGRGMTLLFHGTPGTGKTFAAHCIAKAMAQDILTISAAEIQTSEPGGANRAIQEAFAEANSHNKILFLDECDSLIFDRSSLGMVLGSEVNTLLTEIEKFEGICILSTNRIEGLDPALERRIALIIEFPKPNKEQRKEIWKRILPDKMPLHKEVDLDQLSTHKLTGGLIKNCVLHAARLAVASESPSVTKEHFETAVNRIKSGEKKMGIDNNFERETGVSRSVVRNSTSTKTVTSFMDSYAGEEAEEED